MTKDTVTLLSACEAGTQMAIGAMDGVLKQVKDASLRGLLTDSMQQHTDLGKQARQLLHQAGAQPEEPGAMAKSMSFLKTQWTLLRYPADAGAAELVAGGCDSGVRTLARTHNRCTQASAEAVNVANRLMQLERQLSSDLAWYL